MFSVMRYVAFALLVGALLSAGPAAAQIDRSVSEVTNVERLTSSEMRNLITDEYPGHASFKVECERHPEEGQTWRISFYGFPQDTTEMNRATDVLVEADGEPVTPTLVESKIRQLDSSLLEIKEAEFTRSDFEKIATAKTVNASIGPMQFEMNYHFRKDMRLILERVSPESDATTASTDSNR